MRQSFLTPALTTLFLLICALLPAQTWTGTAGADWNTAANWMGGAVPTASGVVVIPATANQPVINGAAVAKKVKVESAASLTINPGCSLTINGAGNDYGLYNAGTVNSQGSIIIGSQAGSFAVGIDNYGTFVSEGDTIKIDRATTTGLYNHNSFITKSILQIGYTTSGGTTGLLNRGYFESISPGDINISHTTGNGLWNDWGANFVLRTVLEVGKFGPVGLNGILNLGTFHNIGFVAVASAGESGIVNGTGPSNHPTPVFKSSRWFSIGTTSSSVGKYGFWNNVGNVIIENNCEASFVNIGSDGFFNQSGTVSINSGGLLIGGDSNYNYSIGGYGLKNNDQIIIAPFCAFIATFSSILNNAGAVITNGGNMTIRVAPAGTNNGTIINNGAFSYMKGFLAGIINNNILAAPTTASCVGPAPNILQKGPMCTYYTDTIVYSLDQGGYAGIYNDATNTFTPTTAGFGTTGLGFETHLPDPNDPTQVACSFILFTSITISDAVSPTMQCKPARVYLDATGKATVNPSDINNGSFDNCAIAQMTVNQTVFTCAEIGNHSVTLNGTDKAGNVSSCSAIVAVLDALPPKAICKNATINLDAFGQATLNAAQINDGSFDNCTLSSVSVSPANFNCAHVGVNNIATLTALDASGNTSTCTAIVTVKDPIAPIARCKNATVNLASNGSVTVAAFEVDNGSTDNCSLTLSLGNATFNCANVGKNTITFKATDGSGNTSTCTTIITVKDVTPPTALCKNVTIFLDASGNATLSPNQTNNGSTDACGIASMTLGNTLFSCADLGGTPQTVVMTVKDANANISTCTAQITTKDNLAPTAVCENTTVQLGANGTVTVYPATLAGNSFDNCSVWSYSPAAKTYTTANIGNNNLTITVKDWTGNAATCVSVVTVQPKNALENSDARNDNPEAVSTDFKLNLYPNPAAQQTTVAFNLPEEQRYIVQLFDLSGRLVFHEDGLGLPGENFVPIALDEVLTGVYMVDFQANGVRRLMKLVVLEE